MSSVEQGLKFLKLLRDHQQQHGLDDSGLIDKILIANHGVNIISRDEVSLFLITGRLEGFIAEVINTFFDFDETKVGRRPSGGSLAARKYNGPHYNKEARATIRTKLISFQEKNRMSNSQVATSVFGIATEANTRNVLRFAAGDTGVSDAFVHEYAQFTDRIPNDDVRLKLGFALQEFYGESDQIDEEALLFKMMSNPLNSEATGFKTEVTRYVGVSFLGVRIVSDVTTPLSAVALKLGQIYVFCYRDEVTRDIIFTGGIEENEDTGTTATLFLDYERIYADQMRIMRRQR